jgi:phosphopantetheinyl transferase
MVSLQTAALERFIAGPLADGSSVDVYGAQLSDEHGLPTSDLESALDEQERRELSALPDRERRRVGMCRGILRLLLGVHSGLPARLVPLKRDAWGRPHLPPVGGRGGLHVSCSRSRSLAVFAISRAGPVGVDLECLDPGRFREGIAEVFLSERERGLLARVPSADRGRWLARAWTSKEALLKAFGFGLQVDPRGAETSPDPEQPPAGFQAWQWRSPRNLGGWFVGDTEWAGASLTIACPQRRARVRFTQLGWDA